MIHFGAQKVVDVGEVGLIPLHQERHFLFRDVRRLDNCVSQVVGLDFNGKWLVVLYIDVLPLPAVEYCPFDVKHFLLVTNIPIFIVVPFHISERTNNPKQDTRVVDDIT